MPPPPAAAPGGEEPLPPGHRAGDAGLRRASGAVFLAGVAVFAVLYAPQALLPELTRAFAVSPAAATLSVSVATAGLALGLLVLGPLSDRIGRRPVLRAALAVASGLAVLTAAAPAWEALLVLRGLQGFALAGLPAVGVAYLREELDASVSSRAIGLFVGGTAIGGLSGRVVAGALADLGGWRAAVGGIAGLAVACTVAVWVLLPDSRRFVAVPRETPVLHQLARGFGDPVLLGLYGLAALLMGGFVAVYNAGTFRLEAEPYGLSPALAGLVFLTYLLGSVASPVAGGLAERAGRRVVVPVALAVTAAGLALTLAAPLALVVTGLGVLTVGFFAAHGVASGWVAARAALGERPVGQAASLYSFWYYVGSSVGGTLAGRAWAAAGWPGAVVVAGTGIGGALVLALLLGRSSAPGRG
ncbi:MFS transporter [Geodermatophilus arenarius]|uniref:MFS transporter n=1 Tax=Geodermatophilus arenarius TaxID=1137990 RepID=A0ABV9LG73_9ACTN